MSRPDATGPKRTDRRARPLRFETLDTGCFVVVSHKLNQDGYFRKTWGSQKDGGSVVEMFHRFIYRAHHDLDEIPPGYEIDHKCNNRACCNPTHLRLMKRIDHLIHTNRTRYAERKENARLYWLENRCTGTFLAEKFGVTFGQGCRWIRQWKKELQ